MISLEFSDLRAANIARAAVYKNSNGEEGSCDDWTLNDWLAATMGELGEAANLIKKVRRGDFELADAQDEIADELADTIIYLDLLAEAAGIDLGRAVRSKFNRTSAKIGSDIIINQTGHIRSTTDLAEKYAEAQKAPPSNK